MLNKIIKLIIIESIAIVIIIFTILFKYFTNNIFFPEVKFLILLSAIGLTILGLGIWFEKL